MSGAPSRRVFAWTRPYRAHIALVLVLALIDAALQVAAPIIAGLEINAVMRRAPVRQILELAVLTVLPIIAASATSLLMVRSAATVGEGMVYDLRIALIHHLHRLPIGFFRSTSTGALTNRVTVDASGAQRMFSTTFAGVASSCVQVVLTLIAMVALSWQVTALVAMTIPVFLLAMRKMGRRMSQLQRRNAELRSRLAGFATEHLSAGGSQLTRTFGRSGRDAEEFTEHAAALRALGVHTAMVVQRYGMAMAAVPALAAFVVYCGGGWLAASTALSAGSVVSLALLLSRLYTPLGGLVTARGDVAAASVAFERIFETLDVAPQVVESIAAVDLPPGPLSVEFRDVHFAYRSPGRGIPASLMPAGTPDRSVPHQVLRGLSLRVEAGQVAALVGSSGAGKSTVASLLCRQNDVDAGAVTVGGVDIRDVKTKSLNEAVGLVAQDSHMLHTSIAGNLRYADPKASDADLWHALEQAQLAATVRAMPDGLDTLIGEGGYRVSGGERQRLAIARLLLRNPSIVVLDEATAHLDVESEAAVHAALAVSLAGRTALIIAHRLSTVRSADVIFAVDNGVVVEQGTHDELLARGGRYADLYRIQSGSDGVTDDEVSYV